MIINILFLAVLLPTSMDKSYYKYNDNGRIIIPNSNIINNLPPDGGKYWNRLIFEKTQDSRLKIEKSKSFKFPTSIFIFLFIIIIIVFGFNQLIKNNLYGPECVIAAEEEKKSKFSEQLKLLQQNQVSDESLQGGELGGNQDYGDIFGDPNLFKDFGGFD